MSELSSTQVVDDDDDDTSFEVVLTVPVAYAPAELVTPLLAAILVADIARVA